MTTTRVRGLDPATIGSYDRRGSARPAAAPQVRQRWRMGIEARALVLVTGVLLAFGLSVLYSASAIVAMQYGRGSAHFLLRQLSGVLVGAVAFAVCAKVDAERLRKWAWPIMGLGILTMLLTVLPFTQSIAPRINGSRRFLLGGSLQPSELAKLAVIIWTSMLLVKKQENGSMRSPTKGIFPFVIVVGVLALLAALEPDYSIAMMFFLIMAIILFAGGVRIGHFILMGMLGFPVLVKALASKPYIVERIKSYIAVVVPFLFDDVAMKASKEISYQLEQSLVAVGSGGLLGVGFGKGMQQYGFLPFPYSDFIGSNVGEEWGFVGLTVLTLLYGLYAWLGFRIAKRARSTFLQLVAVGLTTTMVLTAFLHVGVVVGLLPTTGLTLPFVSYGRSNLILSLLMTGLLVNIGSEKQRVVGEHATDPLT
jgi:cell division protein FtsW